MIADFPAIFSKFILEILETQGGNLPPKLRSWRSDYQPSVQPPKFEDQGIAKTPGSAHHLRHA
ncbi:MAG: hypothetical protein EBW14_19315 [Oxalobacteraceae bacterium]|nr:hypothetical protein [Oxalobacteraceae bacterium]